MWDRNRLFARALRGAILQECPDRAPAWVFCGVLPDDLYIEPEPWPRIGRPPKHDVQSWTVTDDWPDPVPITDAELFAELRRHKAGRRARLNGTAEILSFGAVGKASE